MFWLSGLLPLGKAGFLRFRNRREGKLPFIVCVGSTRFVVGRLRAHSTEIEKRPKRMVIIGIAVIIWKPAFNVSCLHGRCAQVMLLVKRSVY